MSSDFFYKAARTMLRASQLHIPMNDTFAEIMKIYMTEDQEEFVSNLRSKESYTCPTSAMKLIKTELRRILLHPQESEAFKPQSLIL